MENISCLIYTSIISPHCTEQEIENIKQISKKKNEQANITGILIYTHRHFMQYLEGSAKNICSLFDKIKADNRHHDMLLCYFSDLEKRVFPSWQMGYKDLAENKLYSKGKNTVIPTISINTLTEMLDDSEDMKEVLQIFL